MKLTKHRHSIPFHEKNNRPPTKRIRGLFRFSKAHGSRLDLQILFPEFTRLNIHTGKYSRNNKTNNEMKEKTKLIKSDIIKVLELHNIIFIKEIK